MFEIVVQKGKRLTTTTTQ